MRKISIGGGLVFRQILFLMLLVALGTTALIAIANVRDLAATVVNGDPTDALRNAAALIDSATRLTYIVAFATLFGCVMILAVSIPALRRNLAQPIAKLAAEMTRLSGGDTSFEIAGTERRDEIGEIARALVDLRDSARANAELIQELRAREDRQAQLVREAGIRAEVEEFSLELGRTTALLGDMAQRMKLASDNMIVTSRRATEGSSLAKVASNDAASDVSSVAMASEQLLDSIGEINRRVTQSTTVVQKAVEEARQSSAGMARLSTAARRVGDVVSLISRIAGQTNLLALNATIEAARAGQAGRGFAVVAQEVKNLATQTAKATQDVTDQIAEMQAATDVSVRAIEIIQGKIAEVEQISTSIAAAMQEQGDSTHEIARNVRSAASGAASMSSHVGNVETAMRETGTSAESVAELARSLDEMASRMRARVEEFTGTFAAA